MKVVIFCGGLGTRIRDVSEQVPKPMIPIGQKPILRHIMEYYSHFGHRDFVLCLGYKANVVRSYFLNADASENSEANKSEKGDKVETTSVETPNWRVTMMDTGIEQTIGERLLSVRHLCQDEEFFLATYGDGLTDAPLPTIIDFFKQSGKLACFMSVHPPFNFHLAEFDEEGIVKQLRASRDSNIWINGGYFVFRREIFDYIQAGEELVIEPFNRLIAQNQLLTFKYEGFWRAMDTLRDKQVLEEMCEAGDTPWRMSSVRESDSIQ